MVVLLATRSRDRVPRPERAPLLIPLSPYACHVLSRSPGDATFEELYRVWALGYGRVCRYMLGRPDLSWQGHHSFRRHRPGQWQPRYSAQGRADATEAGTSDGDAHRFALHRRQRQSSGTSRKIPMRAPLSIPNIQTDANRQIKSIGVEFGCATRTQATVVRRNLLAHFALRFEYSVSQFVRAFFENPSSRCWISRLPPPN